MPVAILLIATLVGGQLQGVEPGKECRAAAILEKVWAPTYGEVQATVAAYRAGGSVSLETFGARVRILSAISGIDAEMTGLGYLPDTKFEDAMDRWRRWHERAGAELCAEHRDGRSGCLGQERLTRLWLAKSLALERIRRDLEVEKEVSDHEVVALGQFFRAVTDVPLPVDAGFGHKVTAQIERLIRESGGWDRGRR